MHCHVKLAEQKGRPTIETLCGFPLAVGGPAINRIGVNVKNKHSFKAQVCIWLRFWQKKGCALDAENL